MVLPRALLTIALVFVALGIVRSARADGVAIRLDLVAPGEIKLDGIAREWPSAMTGLNKTISGSGPRTNLGMRGAIAYDEANLYIAGEVTDEHLDRTPACAETEDHASLLIAFPEVAGGFAVHEV